MTDTPGSAAAGNPNPDTPANQSPPDFFAGFDDDAKGYIANKGWKAPADMLSSYRHLETFMGAEKAGRGVVIPREDATPEERASFWRKLGAPEKPDDYEIPLPEKGADENLAKWARETFHKHGLPKAMAKELIADWNAHVGGLSAASQEAEAARAAQEAEALRKEWGHAYTDNIEVARKAAKTFGVPAETVDKLEQSMGLAGVMKLFHNIGSRLGEDKALPASGNDPGSFGALSPAAAQARIAELKSDKAFLSRFLSGDRTAIEQMDRLHSMLVPK